MCTHIKTADVVEVVSKLVSFQSYNPGSDEYDIANYIKQFMENLNIPVQLVPISDRRFNVIARLKGQGKAKPILFCGHMDVVPVNETEREKWNTDPYTPSIIGDELYGRGSADMKGGVGAAMVAMKALHDEGVVPPGDVLFCGTVDEEAVMLGAKALLQSDILKDVKHMVICEPSEMKLFCCCRGRTWADVKVLGESGHASIEGVGNNAITHAIKFVNEINSTKFSIPAHEILGNVFWQVTMIDGGLEPAIIPDTCYVTVDARLIPNTHSEYIWEQVRKILSRMHEEDPRFNAELHIIESREAFECDTALPLVALARQSFETVNIPIEYGGASYTTDGAHLGKLDMDMIIIGPGNIATAHRQNEHVPIDQLKQAAEAYYQMMIQNNL